MRRIDPASVWFTLLLGALGALPPLSIDMALPALPQIGETMHRSIADATLTLSYFMAGFSIAQLIFGPVSDQFGRRPALLLGCGLFGFAGLFCAASPSLNTLLAARFVQGCGAGAGMVMVFAIVRDLFDGVKARSQLSYVSMVLSIAPMIAPTIGAGILALAPWPAIYIILGVGGFLLTVIVWWLLGESLARSDPQALRVDRMLINYGRVFSTRACIGYILINGLSFGCMFAWVAGSSFLMMRIFDLSPTGFALSFACAALGAIVGSFISGKLSQRHVPAHWPLWVGLIGAAVASLILVLLTVEGETHLALFLPLLVVATVCYGMVTPNAAHGALMPLPQIAGVAGATLGFMQMAGGSLASALVAQLSDGQTAMSMTGVMAAFSCTALLIYALWVRPGEKAAVLVQAPEEAELGEGVVEIAQ